MELDDELYKVKKTNPGSLATRQKFDYIKAGFLLKLFDYGCALNVKCLLERISIARILSALGFKYDFKQ